MHERDLVLQLKRSGVIHRPPHHIYKRHIFLNGCQYVSDQARLDKFSLNELALSLCILKFIWRYALWRDSGLTPAASALHSSDDGHPAQHGQGHTSRQFGPTSQQTGYIMMTSRCSAQHWAASSSSPFQSGSPSPVSTSPSPSNSSQVCWAENILDLLSVPASSRSRHNCTERDS